jgi:hypothetical protein
MSQDKLKDPKTLGEALEVYKKFGFKDSEITLNAIILVRMHNKYLAELTKEREARQKGADNVIALYHGWNDMDISPHYSAQTIASIIADVAGHAGIVIEGVNEDMLEGNEPNEGL